MTQPANPWDRTPPVRPSIDDFHGGAKEDDPEEPPDYNTMPNAPEWNEFSFLAQAFGQVVPNAKIDILGGNPATVAAVRSPATAVTTGTLTVTRNGTGDHSITWPANTFPASIGYPEAKLVGGVPGSATAQNITNGVRVKTFDATGTAQDYSATCSVF